MLEGALAVALEYLVPLDVAKEGTVEVTLAVHGSAVLFCSV